MPLSKVELRKSIKNLLSQKTTEELAKKSLELSSQLTQLLNQVGKEHFCLGVYSPIQNEPIWSIKGLKNIAFPRVGDEKMDFHQATFNELVDLGDYSIKEPRKEAKIVYPEILIIPGLAFTLEGYRLGRGGGHYDKYLADFKGIRIGVCFELQIVKELPIEPFDEKVDFIVSEKRVIKV